MTAGLLAASSLPTRLAALGVSRVLERISQSCRISQGCLDNAEYAVNQARLEAAFLQTDLERLQRSDLHSRLPGDAA
jgi:hypothetical protein